MRYLLFSTMISVLLFVSCEKDPASSPAVVSTEEWSVSDTKDMSSTATIFFDSLSNGTVAVSGKWVYNFYGNAVTCKFLSGSASIETTSVVINVTGIAGYPPDSSGSIESSPFNLTMNGVFNNGNSYGNWKISFTKATWDGWIENGSFNGSRKSGAGITR